VPVVSSYCIYIEKYIKDYFILQCTANNFVHMICSIKIINNTLNNEKGGTGGESSAKLQAETSQEIQNMQGQFTKNAQKAVDVLLSKCCEVSLEVPTARVRATQKLYGN